MDERLNLTPIQVSRIHNVAKVNECRISHMLDRNTIALVVKLIANESFIVLKMTKQGVINLATVFPESQSALIAFQQMVSIDCFSFASLIELHKEDRVFTGDDMVHFSTEQLFSLFTLVVDELRERKTVKDFVVDKIVQSKELLEAFHEQSIGQFRIEVSADLAELGLASTESALRESAKRPHDDANDSLFGLDESAIF